MCGIVAATSNRDVSKELINMLRRLDYRGYDSSGISVLAPNGEFRCRKKRGNLDELTKTLGDALGGLSGIGHTRWATHGGPSDLNAHPHFSSDRRVAIVHNGIIENYRELYHELGRNVTPVSETDSEVIAHLLEDFARHSPNPRPHEVVRYLTSKLTGAYAVAIHMRDYPELIIGLRYQCPLNFVHINGFSALSSDISSLAEYDTRVGVLRDGQAVLLRPDGAQVIDFAGRSSLPVYVSVDWAVEEATKGGYPHFVRKEIEEEPDAIISLVRSVRLVETELRRYLSSKTINKAIFLACGSASFSAAFGSILARHWQIPVDVSADIGSEFRYKPAALDQNSLIIAISQSGETADTLGAVGHAARASAGTLSFVNVPGSSLELDSEYSIPLAAGPEVAVPSTKTVTSMFLAGTLLVCLLKENSSDSIDRWEAGCHAVAAAIKQIIAMESAWSGVADKFAGYQSCFALGRGLDYPVALEMALKLKEMAYIHGEAAYAGEFKHGSISLIEYGMPAFCFLGDHTVRGKTISNIEEIAARGARPFILDPGPVKERGVERLGAYYKLPHLDEPWSSISQLAAIHLIAYHVGLDRNISVDRPRNLAKSVTVE